MNIIDLLTTTVQTPTLFPYPLKYHAIFSVLALVFFMWRFVREKRPYQLIMAVAIPLSLVIWVSESRTLFYAVGAIEVVLIIAALVTAIIFKPQEEAAASEKTDENESDETAEETSDNAEETDEESSEETEEESEEETK